MDFAPKKTICRTLLINGERKVQRMSDSRRVKIEERRRSNKREWGWSCSRK